MKAENFFDIIKFCIIVFGTVALIMHIIGG